MNVQHNIIWKLKENSEFNTFLIFSWNCSLLHIFVHRYFWQIEFLSKIWFPENAVADATIQNQFSQINKCTWTRFSLKVTFLQFCVSQLCSIVYFLLNKTFWFGQNTVFSKSRNVFLENVQWFWLFSMKKVSYEWIFQIQ